MNIRTKKGFTINLAGKATSQVGDCPLSETFAIKPADFVGMSRPKPVLKDGAIVKAGDVLFFDKKMPSVKYTAPVSGKLVEIKRGAKRKILEFKILADKNIEYRAFKTYTVSELANLAKADVLEPMLESGVWLNLIQRPYGVVANPEDSPKAIFISTFDSSPLAPNYDVTLKGQKKYIQAGIDVLKKVSNCPIHLTVDTNAEVSDLFNNLRDVENHQISGIHPAGNVGVQIHHIQAISKDVIYWTINPYGLAQIGKLFLEGKYDASKTIALTGSEVENPQYYKTYTGSCLNKFIQEKVTNKHVRVISGNVLVGESVGAEGYLGFYDQQCTVIPEGDKPRFFLTEGWLAPIFSRLSIHRAFGLFSFLNPKKEYRLDSSLNGEHRTFVITGLFESVVPMDILPMHLVKSILGEDYEGMEALGIYEVIEEDFALCEFVDVSKHPIQSMLRKGLDMVRLG